MTYQSIIAASLAVALTLGSAHAASIDERDPEYQRMIDALSNARAALNEARRQLNRARRNNVLEGLRIDLMERDIHQISEDIQFYLKPRRRDLQYRDLRPEGVYFKPNAVPKKEEP